MSIVKIKQGESKFGLLKEGVFFLEVVNGVQWLCRKIKDGESVLVMSDEGYNPAECGYTNSKARLDPDRLVRVVSEVIFKVK